MSSSIIIRPAQKSDSSLLVDLALQAGGGFAEYLLNGVMPNITLRQMLMLTMSSEDLPYCYRTVDVAERGGDIVGMVQYYAGNFLKMPTPDEPSPIPFERLNYLVVPIRRHFPKHALYLDSLATVPTCRGQGIGTALLNHVKEIAKRNGQPLALHVWSDNKNAIALYEREGFKIIEHIDIKRQPLLSHDGGMVLMSR